MSEGLNEHLLIRNLINEDAASFDEIFRRYNERVYSFALRNLKNKADAEGVVQDVFLSLWKDRDKLKELNSLDAWIFTVTFNTIRKVFRKLSREQTHLANYAETSQSSDTSTVTEVEYNDLMEKVEKIIDKLPSRQKTIFILSKREGLSNSEIAKKLEITQKTVENQLSRTKAIINKALVDERLLTTLLFFWLFIR